MQLITTIKERCRMCFTCVRDCPAKAIRISHGQAEVMKERCIGCGNCVLVCSQNAKQYFRSIDHVRELIKSESKVAAIIAPSFPAEFMDINYKHMVGQIRALGFDMVCEVAFGADLVARKYREWVENHPGERRIATTCPAIVSYVEKYHPGLVSSLAPIVSPMVAMGRVLKKIHGSDVKIVFIGPCFAKKTEAVRSGQRDEIDAVLAFEELREMLADSDIDISKSKPSEFDPPHPGLGALFPISRGMIQASGMSYDLLSCDVVAAESKTKFPSALKEFENGSLKTRLLEALCCNGCIMGPGMSENLPYFTRRTAVSEYARERVGKLDRNRLEKEYEQFINLDLSDEFIVDDCRLPLPSKEEIDRVLAKMGKLKPEDELDCGACGYETCREHAIAIHKGLAENEMCLPYTIDRLKQSLEDLNISNEQLAMTQNALITAEKMASMGQLSAGIAHEINNPLGVILLYSKILLENMDEHSEDYQDISMIVEQAERCKTIVAGLLNFAREKKVNLSRVDIGKLIDRCLRAIIKPENIQINIFPTMDDPMVEIDPDQMTQVLTNLIMNAIEAMPDGGQINLHTGKRGKDFIITIEDNGPGISEKIRHKIFEPLFTTKQIGKGTGLGLAVTYGIIKMHMGRIDVVSNAEPENGATGTKFIITLPIERVKNGVNVVN